MKKLFVIPFKTKSLFQSRIAKRVKKLKQIKRLWGSTYAKESKTKDLLKLRKVKENTKKKNNAVRSIKDGQEAQRKTSEE